MGPIRIDARSLARPTWRPSSSPAKHSLMAPPARLGTARNPSGANRQPLDAVARRRLVAAPDKDLDAVMTLVSRPSAIAGGYVGKHTTG